MASGQGFYNRSKLDFKRLLDDPNNIAQNLIGYINAFSANVREIMERFAFDQQIARMNEKNLLYAVVKAFANVDLSPERVDNVQMGYIFEELIRIGAEQSNEEAGEHFTPREVIKLMVNLLLSPEKDLTKSHVVKTIYDPACGTGGMLSVAEEYIRNLNAEAKPILLGQDLNDEAWAVCKSDMLIKGHDWAIEDRQQLALTASERKAVLNALGERDETAEVCRDRRGQSEPDPELRDTENVPLNEDIQCYFEREVLPHVPDAWIDHFKTKTGYEIPFNRHFYVYEPPRPLEEIEAEIKTLEGEILALLKEVTA